MEKQYKTMKERPVSERPYEKCLASGPEGLSDGELLAVILRSGTKDCSALELAWKILEKHPVHKGIIGLYHLDLDMLKELPGIGNVKAIELLCILELSKRLSRAAVSREGDFSAPEHIAAYYMESMRHLDREKVLLLLLDGRHHLKKEIVLSQGTEDSAYVSVKTIFTEAFRCGAVHMILIHNHPSGCPDPSREDLLLTGRIREAGELLGVPLTDHIIIGDRCYISLRERDMM